MWNKCLHKINFLQDAPKYFFNAIIFTYQIKFTIDYNLQDLMLKKWLDWIAKF